MRAAAALRGEARRQLLPGRVLPPKGGISDVKVPKKEQVWIKSIYSKALKLNAQCVRTNSSDSFILWIVISFTVRYGSVGTRLTVRGNGADLGRGGGLR
jgi:hypothetical protein